MCRYFETLLYRKEKSELIFFLKNNCSNFPEFLTSFQVYLTNFMRQKICLLVIILPILGFSQENNLIKGEVLFQSENLEGINILNMTSGEGTISDVKGFFFIKANLKDTLVFSSIQYKVKEHIVTKEDLTINNNLTIYLEDLVNELETVTIRQYSLSGTLKEDLKEIPTFEDKLPIYNARTLMGMHFEKDEKDLFSGVKNNALRDNVGGAAMDINFKMILSPLVKLLKKKIKTPISETKSVEEVLTEQLFLEIKILPVDKYYEFVEYLKEQPETIVAINRNDDLMVLEYLIEQSLIYKEKYGL